MFTRQRQRRRDLYTESSGARCAFFPRSPVSAEYGPVFTKEKTNSLLLILLGSMSGSYIWVLHMRQLGCILQGWLILHLTQNAAININGSFCNVCMCVILQDKWCMAQLFTKLWHDMKALHHQEVTDWECLYCSAFAWQNYCQDIIAKTAKQEIRMRS